MTLAGVICCRTGEPQDFEHCMQCAVSGDPEPCVHPFFLLKAMRDNKASRERAGMSATTLQACQRFTRLGESNDYYEDPQDFKARFRGTIIHGGIEQFTMDEDGIIAEQRFYRNIDVPFIDDDGDTYTERYEISGKMDQIHTRWLHNGEYVVKLTDNKSGGRRTLTHTMEPLESHIEQVNIYRWILADGRPELPRITRTPTKEGDVITEEYDAVSLDVQVASIWYIKDAAMVEIDVPLWPLAQTEEHIRQIMVRNKGMKLPPILPSRFQKSRKTGEVVEIRHWKCDRCPLRELCDTYPKEGVEWFEEVQVTEAIT